jgi:hypothetical protein
MGHCRLPATVSFPAPPRDIGHVLLPMMVPLLPPLLSVSGALVDVSVSFRRRR